MPGFPGVLGRHVQRGVVLVVAGRKGVGVTWSRLILKTRNVQDNYKCITVAVDIVSIIHRVLLYLQYVKHT